MVGGIKWAASWVSACLEEVSVLRLSRGIRPCRDVTEIARV